MQLLKIEIPKDKLSSIPKEEIIFFVQIGNLLSDLSMLQKLTIFSTNYKDVTGIVRAAQNLQTLLLLRIQAGKLYEGWELLHKNFFATGLSKYYEKQLTDPENQSLDNLKRYFGSKTNLISLVRNKFAFHYHPFSEEIPHIIKDLPASEVFEIYVSDHFGNCIFSMSNILVIFAILKNTGIHNTDEAIGKLLSDITKVTGWFSNFLGRCLLIFTEKHLGLKSQTVEIPEPSPISKITLPFFVKAD
jgi:hypothetical protein